MTVVHFDISAVPSTVSGAVLRVPLHCLDAGPPAGVIEIHVFAGDGTASLDEWNVGDLEATVTDLALEYEMLTIDVALLVHEHVAAGHPYLAFRLVSPAGSERYDLASAGGVPPPTLTCTP